MARPTMLLVLLAALSASALGQTTFSSLPLNYDVKLSYVLNGVSQAPCLADNPACVTQVSVPNDDAVIITYTPLDGSANATSTITIRACYNKASTTDRPWRKPNDIISKDKQCSVKVATGLPPQGNFTYVPNDNTAPATYFIQVLEVCAGQYCGKGRSAGQYTIIPIDSRPAWLITMVSIFCCVGPISLAAFFVAERYMKKRK